MRFVPGPEFPSRDQRAESRRDPIFAASWTAPGGAEALAWLAENRSAEYGTLNRDWGKSIDAAATGNANALSAFCARIRGLIEFQRKETKHESKEEEVGAAYIHLLRCSTMQHVLVVIILDTSQLWK